MIRNPAFPPLLLFVVFAACTASPARERPRAGTTPRSAAPSPAPDLLPDRAWGPFESPALFLVLPLPDRDAWRPQQDSRSWVVLAHAPSRSELRIIGWRSDVVSNREGCERDGRVRFAGFPTSETDTVVEERTLASPEGFDTAVRATVRRDVDGALVGTAFAVGASVRRCIAAVFVTRASGVDAERRTAERLRIIIEGTLARARSWTIDDRGAVGREMFLR